MAGDPPGSHITQSGSLQAALDSHLAALQAQQQAQQFQLQQQLQQLQAQQNAQAQQQQPQLQQLPQQQQQQQQQQEARHQEEQIERFRRASLGGTNTGAAVTNSGGSNNNNAAMNSLLAEKLSASNNKTSTNTTAAATAPTPFPMTDGATFGAAGAAAMVQTHPGVTHAQAIYPFTENALLRALNQGAAAAAAAGGSSGMPSGPSVACLPTAIPSAAAATVNPGNAAAGLFQAAAAQQQQQQPSVAAAGSTEAANPNTMDNALSSILRASTTADLSLTAMHRFDEIQMLRKMQGLQAAGGGAAIAQLLSPNSPLADNLEVIRLRAALLGGLRPEDLATLAGQTPGASASNNNSNNSITNNSDNSKEDGDKKKKAAAPKMEELDEDYPLPDLPKIRPLPPLEEGETPHWSERVCVPLATEEDSNWLSERQCFIRAELLEVVRASHQDVLVRSSSKSVAYQQVGIRCRYCAHLHPSARSIRSSAYPSSIRQMYQSFTMMVRDHWAGCTALPPKLKARFMAYQEHKIPSSSLSREYWAYAADKIGMINTDYGITITEESLQKASTLHSFGTTPGHVEAMKVDGREAEVLVHPSDQAAISPYLYLLMSQVEICHLLESERVGKRKEAPVGLSGFGCCHCIREGRLGFCRVFPLNKRSLPTKVNDLYTHLQRCPLTPANTRSMLRKLKKEIAAAQPMMHSGKPTPRFAERDREFVDQIWSKLGRKGAQIGPMS